MKQLNSYLLLKYEWNEYLKGNIAYESFLSQLDYYCMKYNENKIEVAKSL